MKFDKGVADKIVQLYGTGEHSISSICESVGIHRDTFYVWKRKARFSKMLYSVEQKRLDHIKDVATSGLMLLLRGKEFEEVTTEYIEGKPGPDGQAGQPKIRFQRKTKKIVFPNATTVIFTLKNLDSINFPNVVNAELTGKGGSPLAAPEINIQTVASTVPILESENDAEA